MHPIHGLSCASDFLATPPRVCRLTRIPGICVRVGSPPWLRRRIHLPAAAARTSTTELLPVDLCHARHPSIQRALQSVPDPHDPPPSHDRNTTGFCRRSAVAIRTTRPATPLRVTGSPWSHRQPTRPRLLNHGPAHEHNTVLQEPCPKVDSSPTLPAHTHYEDQGPRRRHSTHQFLGRNTRSAPIGSPGTGQLKMTIITAEGHTRG